MRKKGLKLGRAEIAVNGEIIRTGEVVGRGNVQSLPAVLSELARLASEGRSVTVELRVDNQGENGRTVVGKFARHPLYANRFAPVRGLSTGIVIEPEISTFENGDGRRGTLHLVPTPEFIDVWAVSQLVVLEIGRKRSPFRRAETPPLDLTRSPLALPAREPLRAAA